ncbi:Pkinase-domain-containing protein [Piedraia hortae CBS 480.64]|uniref:Pkinase-domain-containing protein n=1 Tax=Piedraia hortae CBS 480.64 TaxID=1314780 RepID=A0A6A7C1N5_9PEZI|nr:Pkinase-domain-containing protein [Piedraia hortae CBS 480.64]
MAARGITVNLPETGNPQRRPHPVKHMSVPGNAAPIKHRIPTLPRSQTVKETLDARTHYCINDDDGASVHRINQYVIKQEIGRGSFGAVHWACDQFGNEYAVKEFSKSRLRKRAQTSLMRTPTRRLGTGVGFNSPLHRKASGDPLPSDNLALIRQEIAIMKKLNHPNLVALYEVLDDPHEDSLYMVLEYCQKGVVMRVGLDEQAEPYSEEVCRCWFQDLILGIEYLHAQGIVHRDIKPDNCLVNHEDVLKVVDFGVSEMFEKDSDMATAKSVGSPAFMPPELCVARHGQISGRAADIWSMGVTLYCLRYGHIPFRKTSIIDLYESIRNDKPPLDSEEDKSFADLMCRLLEKNPDKRITMDELRNHPWVTNSGKEPMVSEEENCADLVEPPTEAEMDHAITGNMAQLFVVMKAVNRFKNLLQRSRSSRESTPPRSSHTSRSADTHDRRPYDKILVTEGVHRNVKVDDNLQRLPAGGDQMAIRSPPEIEVGNFRPVLRRKDSAPPQPGPGIDPKIQRAKTFPRALERARTFSVNESAKGHARNPLLDTLILNIGPGKDNYDHDDDQYPDPPIISESPPGAGMEIYEQAYKDEVSRIMQQRGQNASMFLTRRVEHSADLRKHGNIVVSASNTRGGGLAALMKQMKKT